MFLFFCLSEKTRNVTTSEKLSRAFFHQIFDSSHLVFADCRCQHQNRAGQYTDNCDILTTDYITS